MRRRRFLSGSTIAVSTLIAGCSGSQEDGDGTPTDNSTGTPTDTPTDTPQDTDTPEDETPTEDDEETETEEDEQDVDRPADYRWDLEPGRNDALRSELGQYVSGSVGGVVQDHPAFEFSTDRENDDHTVDFEALKLIRESNFDIMANDPNYDAPMEQIVESFVGEQLFETAKDEGYLRETADSQPYYDEQDWLNADTVEESLDLGHSLVVSIDGTDEQVSQKERGVIMREAYQRHHDFDVLAWEVPMEMGSRKAGMLYSPDDDKVRTFNSGGPWSGNGTAQSHVEIQNWRVIEDPNDEARRDATSLHHPVLFHTDEWDRQGISFEDAKDQAVEMIYSVATDEYNNFNDEQAVLARGDAPVDNITMTTGSTEQLTRTLLDYNKSGVNTDFEDIWDMASFAVGKYIDDPELNGVIDTVEPGDDSYDEYFGGGFAFYEVEDEEVVDEVRNDQSHEYDNFGEVYDQLEAV
ncbi:hypothetical protein RYH80_20100 [Halobaculum sp. MBLA0147]|uniref:hypothetical protein n=1 Tax=Halobaculum sp. MBLA0147 TaxID=3079934 RepID=UPI00352637E4